MKTTSLVPMVSDGKKPCDCGTLAVYAVYELTTKVTTYLCELCAEKK